MFLIFAKISKKKLLIDVCSNIKKSLGKNQLLFYELPRK